MTAKSLLEDIKLSLFSTVMRKFCTALHIPVLTSISSEIFGTRRFGRIYFNSRADLLTLGSFMMKL